MIRGDCELTRVYLLEIVADEYKVDTAKAELCNAQKYVNNTPGCPRCPPQPRALGGGETGLRDVGVGEEGEVGPPTQLLGIVN